jgi:sortase A
MEVINKNSNFGRTVNWQFFLRTKVYSYGFIAIGLLFIASQFVIPFILIESGSSYRAPVENSVLGAATGFRQVNFEELENKTNSVDLQRDYIVPEKFFIQVPKINIKNGMVLTNSFEMNPDDFIGHYAGTSLPGENGNMFLYGHSVMPFLFSEKNYKTIFSNLHKLEEGDEIIVRFNNKRYVYEVMEKFIKKPDEIDPLDLVSSGL